MALQHQKFKQIVRNFWTSAPHQTPSADYLRPAASQIFRSSSTAQWSLILIPTVKQID